MNKVYEKHESSLFGLEANVVAMGVYVIPFLISFGGFLSFMGWLFPLVVVIAEKNSKLVKFHATQALLISLFYGFVNVLAIFTGVASFFATFLSGNFSAILGIIGFAFVFGILVLIIFVLEIISTIKAYQWTAYRLPIIGKWAASISGE